MSTPSAIWIIPTVNGREIAFVLRSRRYAMMVATIHAIRTTASITNDETKIWLKYASGTVTSDSPSGFVLSMIASTILPVIRGTGIIKDASTTATVCNRLFERTSEEVVIASLWHIRPKTGM